MTRLPVAVIGVGHLGKEHARILASLPEVELVGVVDANAEQADAIARRCHTRGYTDHRPLVGLVQAAVVAVPTTFHHAVAREFLCAGVHLLVEKALANHTAQADDLVRLAQENGVLLQVGHVERFNPAFEELLARPIRPRYLTCERNSGFSGRSTDVGVVLDLMIHDLDLVLALVRSPVARVEAMGLSVLGGHEDIAQARVTFANGCVADLGASRISQEPKRSMRVWSSEGFASVDFSKRCVTFTQPMDLLRQGRLDSRRLDPVTLASLKSELFTRHLQTETFDVSQRHAADQLTRELREFVDCVESGRSPRADGVAGRDALALAGAVLGAMRRHAWEGRDDGPKGPHELPPPRGYLFGNGEREAA